MKNKERGAQLKASLLKEIDRWGIPFYEVPKIELRDARNAPPTDGYITHRAPFVKGLGIHWPHRTIVMSMKVKVEPSLAPSIAHELAHVLVGTSPIGTEEIGSGMLALEYDMAHRLDYLDIWEDWQSEYMFNSADPLDVKGPDDISWGGASPALRARLVSLSFDAARWANLLDARGEPTYKPKQYGPKILPI